MKLAQVLAPRIFILLSHALFHRLTFIIFHIGISTHSHAHIDGSAENIISSHFSYSVQVQWALQKYW